MDLKWKNKPVMGVPTCKTDLDRDGVKWSVCVDAPYRGTWHVRVWRDGAFFKCWDTATFKAAKQNVTDYLAGAK